MLILFELQCKQVEKLTPRAVVAHENRTAQQAHQLKMNPMAFFAAPFAPGTRFSTSPSL